MSADRFPRLVSLACHDLRTPLATVFGFARTLSRSGELGERDARFVGMIEEASAQMTRMLDDLGTAARIEGGRWAPALREADTLELATSADERIEASGAGETIETEVESVRRALEALAVAALRYGNVEKVAWQVRGRELELSPVPEQARAVVDGTDSRDLGSLVARLVLETLGASFEPSGDALRVSFP